MTAPRYPDDRIRAVVLEQLERDPTANHALFVDFCAHALTEARGSTEAVADAARQVEEWLARAHVEGGC